MLVVGLEHTALNLGSTMTTKRRNEKTRLLLTLELAVILPAAALVILSAWHVLHIQRDRAVEAAIQRDFSQVLAISEKQINQKAGEMVDDVRTEMPTPEEACSETLDRVLASASFAAKVQRDAQLVDLLAATHRLIRAERDMRQKVDARQMSLF